MPLLNCLPLKLCANGTPFEPVEAVLVVLVTPVWFVFVLIDAEFFGDSKFFANFLMAVLLHGLKTDKYNGVIGEITGSSSDRIHVKLQTGQKISVKAECVTKDPKCAICFKSMTMFDSKSLLCKHVMHEHCMNTWRASNTDVESGAARCPLCRAYVGLYSDEDLQWTKKDPMEIIYLALGSIHQSYARLKKYPEPSLHEELEHIMRQMSFYLKEYGIGSYDKLRAAIKAFERAPSSTTKKGLFEVLKHLLYLHVFTTTSESDVTAKEAIDEWMSSLTTVCRKI